MTKLAKAAVLAIALGALAAPTLASAQTTGSRLRGPVDVVEEVTIIGAITDGTEAAQGEEAADAALAELPAVYEGDEAAPAPAAPQPAR